MLPSFIFFYLLYFLPGTGLDSESRGEPKGKPCGVVEGVAAAVRAHIAEGGAVVVIRGTLPPTSSGTGGAVAGVAGFFFSSILICTLNHVRRY
jgi:hypothetical protein